MAGLHNSSIDERAVFVPPAGGPADPHLLAHLTAGSSSVGAPRRSASLSVPGDVQLDPPLQVYFGRVRTASQNLIFFSQSRLKSDDSHLVWIVTNHMKSSFFLSGFKLPSGGGFKWHLDKCVSV